MHDLEDLNNSLLSPYKLINKAIAWSPHSFGSKNTEAYFQIKVLNKPEDDSVQSVTVPSSSFS